MSRNATVFRYLLALSVALAPMLPAFTSSPMSLSEHAFHSHHVGAPANGHAGAPISGKHAHCNGHCCLACGMAFAETSVVLIDASYAPAVQVPVVVRLHSHPLIAVLERPPRTLS